MPHTVPRVVVVSRVTRNDSDTRLATLWSRLGARTSRQASRGSRRMYAQRCHLRILLRPGRPGRQGRYVTRSALRLDDLDDVARDDFRVSSVSRWTLRRTERIPPAVVRRAADGRWRAVSSAVRELRNCNRFQSTTRSLAAAAPPPRDRWAGAGHGRGLRAHRYSARRRPPVDSGPQ